MKNTQGTNHVKSCDFEKNGNIACKQLLASETTQGTDHVKSCYFERTEETDRENH